LVEEEVVVAVEGEDVGGGTGTIAMIDEEADVVVVVRPEEVVVEEEVGLGLGEAEAVTVGVMTTVDVELIAPIPTIPSAVSSLCSSSPSKGRARLTANIHTRIPWNTAPSTRVIRTARITRIASRHLSRACLALPATSHVAEPRVSDQLTSLPVRAAAVWPVDALAIWGIGWALKATLFKWRTDSTREAEEAIVKWGLVVGGVEEERR